MPSNNDENKGADDEASLPITTAPNTTTTIISCGLCYEDKPSSGVVRLAQCCHEGCRDCFLKWIQRAEASGQTTPPLCPFCRRTLSHKDVKTILGRPFTPRSASSTTTTTTTAVAVDDQLTLDYLRQHTRPCPHCGACIEKVPGGCDKMECLCGCRFCYRCGTPNAQCACTPQNHSFWDNIFDRASGETPHMAPLTEIATVEEDADEDQAGPRRNPCRSRKVVDLKRHIDQRKREARQRNVRTQRSIQRRREAMERDTVDELVFSAKWLFCRKTETTIRVLQQIMAEPQVRQARVTQQQAVALEQKQIEDTITSAKWLFCGSSKSPRADPKQLPRLLMACNMRQQRLCRSSAVAKERDGQELVDSMLAARVLFATKSGPGLGSTQLQQLLRRESVQNDRSLQVMLIQYYGEPDDCFWPAKWLYCKDYQTCLHVLWQLEMANTKRQSRNRLNATVRQEQRDVSICSPAALSAPWLFTAHRETALRILAHLVSNQAHKVREQRMIRRVMLAEPPKPIELQVATGQWLFQHKCRIETLAELAMIFNPFRQQQQQQQQQQPLKSFIICTSNNCSSSSSSSSNYNSGSELSVEERTTIARRRGTCPGCGIRTHVVNIFRRVPITNSQVRHGECIRCTTVRGGGLSFASSVGRGQGSGRGTGRGGSGLLAAIAARGRGGCGRGRGAETQVSRPGTMSSSSAGSTHEDATRKGAAALQSWLRGVAAETRRPACQCNR